MVALRFKGSVVAVITSFAAVGVVHSADLTVPPLAPVQDFSGWYLRGDTGFGTKHAVSPFDENFGRFESARNKRFDAAPFFGLGDKLRLADDSQLVRVAGCPFGISINPRRKSRSVFFSIDESVAPRRPPVEVVVEPNSQIKMIGNRLNACNGFYGNYAAGEDFAVSLNDQRTVESCEWSTQLERIGKRRDTARRARACQRQLDPAFVQLRGRRFRGVGHLVIRRDERAVDVRYHERDGAGI